MGESKETISELTDLPNYKDIFTGPLAEFGVTTLDELIDVLGDEERTTSMISAIKGMGPRTVQLWKKALSMPEKKAGTTETAAEEPSTESDEGEKGAEQAEEETPTAPEEPEREEEQVEEETVSSETKEEEELPQEKVEATLPRFERNLFCTMADLELIQKTAIDLLQMNGSKRKGLNASVEYAMRELTGAGMEVTVLDEDSSPVVLATKGDGGIVLWGHLDTERLDGMKRKKQGIMQGDMISGRGAANMKGAVAAMICAANRLVSWHVPFSIVLTTDALEQQKGAETVANESVVRHSKGIIMFTPTGMRPVIGQYGYAAIMVTTSGDDSVIKMASFLKTLTSEIGDSNDRISVKTGLIRGGRRKMPYAPALSCEVVLELETKDSTDSAIAMIEAILEGVEHRVDIICKSEMAEFDRTNDLVAAVTELTRTEPVFEMIHSEAVKIVNANPKIVICGPGDIANSLTNKEYVTLSDLEKTFESILSLVDGAEPLENE